MLEYKITERELKCINILIQTLNEAIHRQTFSEHEISNIYKCIDILTSRNVC